MKKGDGTIGCLQHLPTEEEVVLGETTGARTVAKEKRIFISSPEFKELDVPAEPTGEVSLSCFKLRKGRKPQMATIVRHLAKDPAALAFTQDQMIGVLLDGPMAKFWPKTESDQLVFYLLITVRDTLYLVSFCWDTTMAVGAERFSGKESFSPGLFRMIVPKLESLPSAPPYPDASMKKP